MNKNPVLVVVIKQLLSYLSTILRNILYLPLLTSLSIYLFIFLILITGTALSDEAGVNFINFIIKTLFDLNILSDTMSNISIFQDSETTQKQFIFLIVGFGIVYDLIIRVILFFKKDFDKNTFQRKILKLLKIFYISSFVLSSVLILFVVKDWVWIIALLIILLVNIISLAVAYSATVGFRLIRESLK